MKLNKLERRRLVLFLICFAIAVIAWSFFALSARYTFLIEVPIRYTNIPQKRVCHPLQADSIRLQIQSTGWQILLSKIKMNAVYIDLKNLDKQDYALLSRQIPYIQNQLELNQKITQIKPDTLFFDFHKRITKKVPITLLYDLNFNNQHNISGKVQLRPSYVTLAGSDEDLAGIQTWQTETLKLSGINQTITAQLALKHSNKSSLHISPSVVEVKVPVDEFTEKSVEVPLKVLNNSTFEDVKLLPKKVKITFWAALKDYNQVDYSFFDASVDLNKWHKNNYRQLPVVLNRFPEYCKLIHVEPQYIDFIVNK